MSRQTAIRAKCIDCSGGSPAEVRRCSFKNCPLYPYRITQEAGRGQKAKAIKDFCLECCNGSAAERTQCTAVNCPLYEYRRGKRQKTPDKAKTSAAGAI